MSQLHWKDSSLVIELGRLYLGRARVIRVTMAPGPLGRELPLREASPCGNTRLVRVAGSPVTIVALPGASVSG